MRATSVNRFLAVMLIVSCRSTIIFSFLSSKLFFSSLLGRAHRWLVCWMSSMVAAQCDSHGNVYLMSNAFHIYFFSVHSSASFHFSIYRHSVCNFGSSVDFINVLNSTHFFAHPCQSHFHLECTRKFDITLNVVILIVIAFVSAIDCCCGNWNANLVQW